MSAGQEREQERMTESGRTRLEDFLHENDSLLVAESVQHCLELLTSGGSLGGPFYYYRGVSSARHQLLTSLDRVLQDREVSRRQWREQYFVEHFMKVAHNHLPPTSLPKTAFEWLSVMQHYGIPTRLLDVTRSPFVALYFAVRNWSANVDGALWAFNPTHFHEVALYRLGKRAFPHKISRFSIFHLPEFISDKYFREAFLSGKYPIVTILEPAKTDLRLSSQQGAFMIAGSIAEDLEASIAAVATDESHMDHRKAEMLRRCAKNWSVVKLVIPQALKRKLFQELRRMNVHAGTLFPDLEGAARSIAELASNDQFTDMTWRVSKEDKEAERPTTPRTLRRVPRRK